VNRTRLALVAFFGHWPGLWLLHRFRFNAPTLKLNLWAAFFTALAVAGGALSWGGWAALGAFLLGSVGWSVVLARRVWRGEAGAPASLSPPP